MDVHLERVSISLHSMSGLSNLVSFQIRSKIKQFLGGPVDRVHWENNSNEQFLINKKVRNFRAKSIIDFRWSSPFNGRTSLGQKGATSKCWFHWTFKRTVEVWRSQANFDEAILIRMFSFKQSYLANILRMLLNRKAKREPCERLWTEKTLFIGQFQTKRVRDMPFTKHFQLERLHL